MFGYIQRDTGERCKFLVRASYLQIYNEVRCSAGGGDADAGPALFCCRVHMRVMASMQPQYAQRELTPPTPAQQVISDLLKPESVNLVVREDRRRGVHVEGLSEWVVRSPAGGWAA